jgi:pimeloyl-ACP methyl ester carboxylesterase
MKQKLLITLLIFSSSITIAQNLIAKPRAAEVEINSQNFLQKNSLTINQKLPYPIIFIHGLNSSSDTWMDMGTNLINKGLSFGGRIDFCLNDDGNNYTSNKNVWTSTNNNIPAADIALYTNYNTDLTIADFYFLNFNIDNLGRLPNNASFTDVLSNEAAIAKQGVALKLAIQMVLLKTGRDKVILMGHSMGGLASREYIQNSSNWQNDGQHHVAKLITTGTPHGGYTGTNNQSVTGIDGQSEAYRDLRKSYSWTGYDGVYLYGGTENSSIIKNILLYPFYNVDVNCNGIDGDNTNITGLNQRQWRTELDYSYIVGICTNCSLLQGTIEGDGIVRSENANLSNFTTQLPAPKNEFTYTADAIDFYIGLHSDLPKAIPVSMQGLDEPNEYSLAYGIDFNQQYEGFITQQPTIGYPYDYDDYKFTMPNNGSFSIAINNSFSGNLPFKILNTNLNTVYTNTVAPNSTNTFTQTLSAGQYYIEFYATPSSISYLYPYTFIIQNTLSINNNLVDNTFSIYPNPTNSKVNIKSEIKFDEVEIYNVLGQNVLYSKISENQEVDMSLLQSGTYFLKLKNENMIKNVKIIKL